MGKIFSIIGKSGTGKDTLYQNILSCPKLKLSTIISYTTRPMRSHEKDGVEYHFVTEQDMIELERLDKVLEKRDYSTTQGIWSYFTLKFEIDNSKDYLIIATPMLLKELLNYYGKDRITVVHLEVNDKLRLERAISRESEQKNPNYLEVCRRYLADEEDFNQICFSTSNITINTENPIETCMEQVVEFINIHKQ